MTAITAGQTASDRASTKNQQYTLLNYADQCNASGKITSVEIWMNTSGTGVKVGMFYYSSPSWYSRAGYASIGSVTSGSKQTFSGLDITCVSGDSLGMYASGGKIEADTSGSPTSVRSYSGDLFGSSGTMATATGNAISLYGTGSDVTSYTKTGTALGSILATITKTGTAKGRVKIGFTKTTTAKGRIKIAYTKTMTALAKMIGHPTMTAAAKARLKLIGITKTGTAKGRTQFSSDMHLRLLPSANGDTNQWWQNSGSDPNYSYVDDAAADDSSTYLENNADSTERKDLFNFPDPDSFYRSYLISNVRIYARVQKNAGSTEYIKIGVKISSTEYWGSDQSLPSSYTSLYADWATNPATGAAWAWSDIDALQAGVKSTANGNIHRLTQIILDITFGYTTKTSTAKARLNTPGLRTTTSKGDVKATITKTLTAKARTKTVPVKTVQAKGGLFKTGWRTIYLRPTGDGSEKNIPYPAGTHYNQVNEVTADDGVTVVYLTGTMGDAFFRDLYTFTQMSGITDDILGIVMRIRVISAVTPNSANLKACWKIGATVYESEAVYTTNGWADYDFVIPYSPNIGIPWTINNVNNAEFGFAVKRPATNNTVYVSQAYISVLIAETRKTAMVYANIKLNTTRTLAALARIKSNIVTTTTAKGRLIIGYTKTVTAKGKLVFTFTRTVTAEARIFKNTVKTSTALGRLKIVYSKTMTAKADIKTSVSKTITAKGRIGIGVTKTITAKAKLVNTFTKTAFGKARVIVSLTRVMLAKGRVNLSYARSAASKAKITFGGTKRGTAKAFIHTAWNAPQPRLIMTRYSQCQLVIRKGFTDKTESRQIFSSRLTIRGG